MVTEGLHVARACKGINKVLQVVSSNAVGVTERRENQRLDIQFRAKIKFQDGKEYQGHTRNISYKGALLEIDVPSKVNQGEYCVFTLIYNKGHTQDSITLSCKILHRRTQGVALQFKSIREDEYNKLVLLLAEYFPETDDLLAEMDNDFLLAWVRSSSE